MENQNPQLSDEETAAIIEEAVRKYSGQMSVLESAVGALIIGRMFGWHVLRLMHASPTYGKYEKILGVKFREVLPTRGPEANTVAGIKLADKVGTFWKALSGGLLSTYGAKEKKASA